MRSIMNYAAYKMQLFAYYDMPKLRQDYQSEVAALTEYYYCDHENMEFRLARWGDQGKTRVRTQCSRCGDVGPVVSQERCPLPDGLPWVDPKIRMRYLEEKQQATAAIHRAFREEAQRQGVILEYEVREEYERYINGPVWAARRKRVLERDQYLCQACLDCKATQVHHLTYGHFGDELMFELIAICKRCHDRIHAIRTYETDSPWITHNALSG